MPYCDFPGYWISNWGRLKSRYRIISPNPRGQGGYLSASLSNGNKRKDISLHITVAQAFIPNPNPTFFTLVHHKDGDKWNNVADNLEWSDASGNRRQHIKEKKNYLNGGFS